MKKQRSWLNIFSFLLIFSGIILLALPRISSWVIERRASGNVENVENMDANTLKNNLNSESSFDFDSISQINPSGTFLGSEHIDESLIVGRLFIPNIDLNLTVYNGLSNSILHAGVGTMRPGLEMGERNFPIAGHYSRNKNALFGDLYSIEEGDKIYLTDNETVYEYEAYRTEVANDTDIHYIQDDFADEHGKSVISLMNCYYVDGRDTGDRYFVFGELTDTHDFSDVSNLN